VTEQEFWVVYDYGVGGVWGIAGAQSETEIVKAFAELKVVQQTPAWMTAEVERKGRSVSSFTVAEPSTYPKWLRTFSR
jgi:hypothetical protein